MCERVYKWSHLCKGARPQPMKEVKDEDIVEEEDFEYEEEFEVG